MQARGAGRVCLPVRMVAQAAVPQGWGPWRQAQQPLRSPNPSALMLPGLSKVQPLEPSGGCVGRMRVGMREKAAYACREWTARWIMTQAPLSTCFLYCCPSAMVELSAMVHSATWGGCREPGRGAEPEQGKAPEAGTGPQPCELLASHLGHAQVVGQAQPLRKVVTAGGQAVEDEEQLYCGCADVQQLR